MKLGNSCDMLYINNVLPALTLLGNKYHKQIDEQLLFLSQDVRISFFQTPALKDTILTSFIQLLAIDYYEKKGISVKLEKYVKTDTEFIDYVTGRIGEGNLIPVVLRHDNLSHKYGCSNFNVKHCLLIVGICEDSFFVIYKPALSFQGKDWKGYISYEEFFSEWVESGRLYYNVDYDSMKNHIVDSRVNESIMKNHSLGFFDVGNMADFVLNIPYRYTEQEIKMYLRDVCYKIEYSCIVPTRFLLNRSLERIERDYNNFVFSENKYKLEELVKQWKNVAKELLSFSRVPKTSCFRDVANILYNIADQEKKLSDSIHEKVCHLFQQ